jgi:hypothetical protein
VKTVKPAQQGDYFVSLLKLLLAASKEEGETIEYQFAEQQYTQSRWMVELSREKSNGVLWTMTSKDRERMLTPIREPMFRGLIGQRVLVIRREDQDKFAQIHQLAQLQTLMAGQGAQWPDTGILQANGLTVIEASSTEQLYRMLAAKRFDYFPRGVMEITGEQAFLDKYNLIVEPYLVISYPAAMYFFVNKNNHNLAQRLRKGWEIVYANKTFDDFFYGHPRVRQALMYLSNIELRPIYLHNPDAPVTMKVDPLSVWTDPEIVRFNPLMDQH